MDGNTALFAALLNELDITYADEQLVEKMKDIQRRADGYLRNKYGGAIDYEEDMQARELFFSYCRYARSNAIEQFEQDFLSEILNLSIRGGIEEQRNTADEEQKR